MEKEAQRSTTRSLGTVPHTSADGADRGLESELAALIVESLNLDVEAAAIDPEAALFGEGLGLDSIDILEIALAVSKKYGFQLRSDDDGNRNIFQSLRSLARHIADRRTK
jgi:acyl carrier protein